MGLLGVVEILHPLGDLDPCVGFGLATALAVLSGAACDTSGVLHLGQAHGGGQNQCACYYGT